MGMKYTTLLIAAAIAASTMAAGAHHSISGVYDMDKRLTVEGVVTEFRFINPHPFVLMEVTPAAGAAQSWQLELDNRSELVQIGMNSQTLKQGDRVIVTGSPGRAQAQSLYVSRLDRPADGFRYEQIGSTPRIRKGK
jgi:hypothetical protein